MKKCLLMLLIVAFTFGSVAYADESSMGDAAGSAEEMMETEGMEMESDKPMTREEKKKALKERLKKEKAKRKLKQEKKEKAAKGIKKQKAKKALQERKEMGKGSEQGQQAREGRRKWWQFWGADESGAPAEESEATAEE